ncbi:MAG: AAA family ATPase, partial [Candidatus Nitrosocosmicus sp.]|nr:AAA family ATPase [Candidatus Nitrosocosmicus sp.]
YESIIIGNKPMFVKITKESFEYVDYIQDGEYRFYPIDNILTHNPIPYSFTSKEELEHYIILAKEETFSSMFEKVFDQYGKYVNAEEHSLVIFAADTIYSYFQNRFGNTHYNILVGEPGSGKNSALLAFKFLGYRVFYVTSASAANYNTFLGEIQEGQGTIAEDEADDIGSSSDKKIY